MSSKLTIAFLLLAAGTILSSMDQVQGNPAIAAIGYDTLLDICIENCAQCKKMYGAWFRGPQCAESCFKYKGKAMPDCEDFSTISRFLVTERDE